MPASEGFLWLSGIYLQSQGHELDMHDDFDFERLIYDVGTRTVTLEWHRGTRDGLKTTLPSRVVLRVAGVRTFEVRPRNDGVPFTEDDCLSSFGYRSTEDWCKDQFWTDARPDPHWKWSFAFQSGTEIVIGGGVATATIEL